MQRAELQRAADIVERAYRARRAEVAELVLDDEEAIVNYEYACRNDLSEWTRQLNELLNLHDHLDQNQPECEEWRTHVIEFDVLPEDVGASLRDWMRKNPQFRPRTFWVLERDHRSKCVVLYDQREKVNRRPRS